MDSEPAHADPVDAVLDGVFAFPADHWPSAIQAACAEHPDLAPVLRRRFGALQRSGLIESAAKAAERVLGGYRIGAMLGAGAMGVVHAATRVADGMEVALKLLRPELSPSPAAMRRLRREAQVLSALQHEALCRVVEVGEIDGQPFLAMERLGGSTLDQHVDRARRRSRSLGEDPLEPVRWIAQIARGLGVAHEAGVVHRDIKPGNIMLREDGRPVLFDFGLASRRDDTGLTRSGTEVGTPAYMAPEQIRNAATVDARADVWALGAVLYECLALRAPFDAPGREALYRQISSAEPVALHRLRADLPRGISSVVMRCLEKDPRRREDSAAGVAEDLDRVLAGQRCRARSPGIPRRIGRAVRRRPWTVASCGVATLVALLAVLAWRLAQRDARYDAAVLASYAERVRERSPRDAALLAWNAFAQRPDAHSRTQLLACLADVHQIGPAIECEDFVIWAARSPAQRGTLLTLVGGLPADERGSTGITHPEIDTLIQRVGESAAWSPSGDRYAVGGPNRVRMFDALQDQEIPLEGDSAVRLVRHPEPRFQFRPTVAFGPDDRLHVAAADGFVHVFDSGGRAVSRWPVSGRDSDPCVAVFPGASSGGTVAVTLLGGIQVCRADGSLMTLAEPPARPGAGRDVRRVARSGDGNQLVLVWSDGPVVRHDVSGRVGPRSIRVGANASCAAVSATGERLVIGNFLRATLLLDDAVPGLSLVGFGDSVMRAALAFPEPVVGGRAWAAGDDRGAISLLSPRGEVLHRFAGHTDDVVHLVLGTDGNSLLSCSWDRTVRLWRAGGAGRIRTLFGRRPALVAAAESGGLDGSVLGLDNAGQLFRWRATGGGPEVSRIGRAYGRGALAVAPVGHPAVPRGHQLIATWGQDKPIRIYDIDPDAPLPDSPIRVIDERRHDFGGLQFTRDYRLVAFGGFTRRLACYGPDLATEPLYAQREESELPTFLAMAVHPSGERIATLTRSGSWLLRSWDRRLRPVADPVDLAAIGRCSSLAYLPGRNRLLIGTESGVLAELDLRSGALDSVRSIHAGQISRIAATADRYVTFGTDNLARVWSPTGVLELDVRHAGLRTGQLSEDGARLLTVSTKANARIWPVEDSSIERAARERLGLRSMVR